MNRASLSVERYEGEKRENPSRFVLKNALKLSAPHLVVVVCFFYRKRKPQPMRRPAMGGR